MVYIRFKNERGSFDYFVGASRQAVLDDTSGGTEFCYAKLISQPEELDSERVLAAAIQAGGNPYGFSPRKMLDLGVTSVREGNSSTNFYLFSVDPS